jgi:hypothetical protein
LTSDAFKILNETQNESRRLSSESAQAPAEQHTSAAAKKQQQPEKKLSHITFHKKSKKPHA